MDKKIRGKKIIDAALKVFSRDGYSDTRMADIAKECNISYGLIYHYFGNKEKLFESIVEDWWKEFYQIFESLKKSSIKTPDKLTEIVKRVLEIYKTNPALISIFVMEISRGFIYHNYAGRKEKFLKLFSLCEEIIHEGQTEGSIRKDIKANFLTYIFLGAIDTVISIMILGNERLTESREKRAIDGIISVFMYGATNTVDGLVALSGVEDGIMNLFMHGTTSKPQETPK